MHYSCDLSSCDLTVSFTNIRVSTVALFTFMLNCNTWPRSVRVWVRIRFNCPVSVCSCFYLLYLTYHILHLSLLHWWEFRKQTIFCINGSYQCDIKEKVFVMLYHASNYAISDCTIHGQSSFSHGLSTAVGFMSVLRFSCIYLYSYSSRNLSAQS